MLTGFKTVGGKEYYFMDSKCKTYKSADQGMVMNGFFTVDGNLYYGMNSKVKGYKAEDHSVIVRTGRPSTDVSTTWARTASSGKGGRRSAASATTWAPTGRPRSISS